MFATRALTALFLLLASYASSTGQERRRIELYEGKSVDVRLSEPFKDVIINTDKADVVPVTDRVLRIYGLKRGSLALNLIGKLGRPIAILDVTVLPSEEPTGVHVGPKPIDGPKTVHPPDQSGSNPAESPGRIHNSRPAELKMTPEL